MNKIRWMALLILLVLVCPSICWSPDVVWQRAAKTGDLYGRHRSHPSQEPQHAEKWARV